MKKILSILTFMFITHIGWGQDLIITGVFDGPLSGGTPKVVELYVLNDIPDLSIYGLGAANNGGGTDGEEYTFPADAATQGSFIYVTDTETEFASFFGFSSTYSDAGSAVGFNGDDAVELFQNGAVVDVFGDINVDGSGEAWDYLDGWAYRVSGTTASSTFNVSDWTYSGINVLDGETSNSTAATPFPVGTFTPSSTPAPIQINLSVDNSTIAENGGTATITATLSADTTVDITFPLPSGFTLTGTATVATDYTSTSITDPVNALTIPAGSTTTTINVTAIDDSDVEDDETIIVTLSETSPSVVIGANNTVTITIMDDDGAPPTITDIATIRAAYSSTSDSTFDEDVYITGIVISEEGSVNNQNIIIQDGTAGIVIRSESGSQTAQRGDSVVININGGVLSDFNDLIQVQNVPLSAVTNVATVGIPTPQVITLTEMNTGNFESQLVTVEGVEFTTADGITTFADEFEHEISKDAVTGFSRATNSAFSSRILPRGTGNLSGIPEVRNGLIRLLHQVDSDIFADTPPTFITASIAVDNTTISENGGEAVLTAFITSDTTSDVTVNLTISGTATNGTDYSTIPTSITINSGDTFATVTITGINDSDIEGDETIGIKVSSADVAVNIDTVGITINDDDRATTDYRFFTLYF